MSIRYTNCKLSAEVVNKIVSYKDISSDQIDMLIWLSRYQNIYGRVYDIKYYDACNDMGISHQQFYNIIDNLVCAGFIRVLSRSNRLGWDIEIFNNTNTGEESDRSRYLNTNKGLFFTQQFRCKSEY